MFRLQLGCKTVAIQFQIHVIILRKQNNMYYSSTSLVRASVVRGPSVVRAVLNG